VTFDATASPSRAGYASNPALTAALAITAIAAATLAGAWFFQLVLDIRPCPLCLEQRYAYYLAIPLGVLIAIAAARDTRRAVLIAALAVLAAAALANAVLGT
jgi:disulfide bond formation protein DsbB